jgi:hypothetical protein
MNKTSLLKIVPLCIAAVLGGIISQVIAPSMQAHAQLPPGQVYTTISKAEFSVENVDGMNASQIELRLVLQAAKGFQYKGSIASYMIYSKTP